MWKNFVQFGNQFPKNIRETLRWTVNFFHIQKKHSFEMHESMENGVGSGCVVWDIFTSIGHLSWPLPGLTCAARLVANPIWWISEISMLENISIKLITCHHVTAALLLSGVAGRSGEFVDISICPCDCLSDDWALWFQSTQASPFCFNYLNYRLFRIVSLHQFSFHFFWILLGSFSGYQVRNERTAMSEKIDLLILSQYSIDVVFDGENILVYKERRKLNVYHKYVMAMHCCWRLLKIYQKGSFP